MAQGTNLLDWTTPQTGSNVWGIPTADVLSTFEGRPGALWQAAQAQQLGQRAFIPQFQRTIGQGFTPAYGSYLLAGGGGPEGNDVGTFASYLGGAGQATRQAQALTDWTQAVEASRRMDPGYPAATGTLTAQQLGIQGALGGEGARANALAMAQAGMGGARGYMGQARQRALGNLYDIYAARAEAAGRPTSGFLGYLGGQMGTTSP